MGRGSSRTTGTVRSASGTRRANRVPAGATRSKRRISCASSARAARNGGLPAAAGSRSSRCRCGGGDSSVCLVAPMARTLPPGPGPGTRGALPMGGAETRPWGVASRTWVLSTRPCPSPPHWPSRSPRTCWSASCATSAWARSPRAIGKRARARRDSSSSARCWWMSCGSSASRTHRRTTRGSCSRRCRPRAAATARWWGCSRTSTRARRRRATASSRSCTAATTAARSSSRAAAPCSTRRRCPCSPRGAGTTSSPPAATRCWAPTTRRGSPRS